MGFDKYSEGPTSFEDIEDVDDVQKSDDKKSDTVKVPLLFYIIPAVRKWYIKQVQKEKNK